MGKKNNAFAAKARADAMAEALLGLGYEPTSTEPECVIARGPAVHIYCDFRQDHICFSRTATFDRWANSRDYIFEGIPEDDDDLALAVLIAEESAKKKLARGDDFEPVSLNQFWRQYKRIARTKRNAEEVAEAALPAL